MDISINVPTTSKINISGNTKEITVPDKSITYAKLADDVTLILSEKSDKASVDAALEQKADKLALERIKYYGSADVVPSDESWFTVNDTGETITGLTDEGKTQTELVIPYKINGIEITRIFESYWTSILDGNTVITKVVLPNSVTSIGAYAFYNCTSLTSINIPNGVTSISDYVFSECTSLTIINIPNSVTSIGNNAFESCTSLKTVEIPNSVTSISSFAFYNCTSLTSINIPNGVTRIYDSAFHNCTNLTIYCEQGSYAETYAKNNNIPVVYTEISSAELDKKANTSDVLNKTNTTEFTPTADYQPATKKYADDAISAAISAYDTEAMALLGGDTE